MEEERVVALRAAQLAGLGILAYGIVRRSWPASLTGIGLIAFDTWRQAGRHPEFTPLDFVAPRAAGTEGAPAA